MDQHNQGADKAPAPLDFRRLSMGALLDLLNILGASGLPEGATVGEVLSQGKQEATRRAVERISQANRHQGE